MKNADELPWPGNQYAGDRRWRPCDWLLFPHYLKAPAEPDPNPDFGKAVVREFASAFILVLGLVVVALSTVLHTSTP